MGKKKILKGKKASPYTYTAYQLLLYPYTVNFYIEIKSIFYPLSILVQNL